MGRGDAKHPYEKLVTETCTPTSRIGAERLLNYFKKCVKFSILTASVRRALPKASLSPEDGCCQDAMGFQKNQESEISNIKTEIPASVIIPKCRTGVVLPGAPEFLFLEPKRFRKKENELQTYQEKWLFLLRNAKSLSVIPETFAGDKASDAYFSASETANLTKEERILYDQAMITKTDIEYGKLYSFKKGLAKGEAKGIEKGRKETQRELAKKMLDDGFDIGVVEKYTGIEPSELRKLSLTILQ